MESMEAALLREVSLFQSYANKENYPINSVYFGGGTPSLFSSQRLRNLLHSVVSTDSTPKEITLEANPEDVTKSVLAEWRDLGVTRLSLGIQSFDDAQLRWMNRQHTGRAAEQAVFWAREAGFQHISADLIYGLPNRGFSFHQELKQFLSLPVDHLSAYILTVEDKTVLGRRVHSGREIPPEEGQIASEYRALCNAMEEAGFEHYEVSNWAKPGGRAVHNQHYWSGLPYWGIGPGAHSFDGTKRRANISNNAAYIRALASAQSLDDVPAEVETLGHRDRYNESIMTGLRTSKGINLDELAANFGYRPDRDSPHEWERLLRSKQLVHIESSRVRIPESAWLLGDQIAADLFLVDGQV